MKEFEKNIKRFDTCSEKYHNARDDLFISLSVADMDFHSPKEVKKQIIKGIKKNVLGYHDLNKEFFTKIIKWYERRDILLKEDEILYSSAVMNSVVASLYAFSEVGDEILLLTPEYPSFKKVILNHERVVLECDIIEKIDFKAMQSLVSQKTKILLLSNPHNPIGKIFSKKTLRKIGEFCEKNKLILISDEIHSDLVFKKFNSAFSIKENENFTIVLNSPTKTFNLMDFAPSYALVKNEIIRKKLDKQLIKYRYKNTNLINNISIQYVYHESKWLEKLLKKIQKNIKLTKTILKNSDISFKTPDATYLLWLNFTKVNLSSDELLKRFAQAKIELLDGRAFSKNGDKFFRMNIALPKDKLKIALNRILSCLN